MSHLGYKFVRLDGQTPVAERMALIDNFNGDKVRVCAFVVVLYVCYKVCVRVRVFVCL